MDLHRIEMGNAIESDIPHIDENFQTLGDAIDSASAAASAAQGTADGANSAASAAQATADEARSTADNAVPNTRTINGKALTSDITLTSGDIDIDLSDYIPTSEKGEVNGVASLGTDGYVPTAQLRFGSTAQYGVVKVHEGNGLVIVDGVIRYELTEVSVPAQSETLTYTGAEQSPTWGGYDTSKMTISGTTSATDAGTYSAVFSLVQGYMWEDGSTDAKTVTWTIGKAAGSLSLSASSASIIGASGTTKIITVTRTGDGAISAVSSNTSVATVSVSGTTVTIKAVATGSATITVSVAEGTNHTAPSSKTCAVTIAVALTTLNDNTWATIKAISDAGVGASVWSVGDAKAVTLSGTVGVLDMSDTYYCFILGFDHNSGIEGSNRIHFQFGKTETSNGIDVAFIDINYNSANEGFRMNITQTNAGGWSSSYMRNTICEAFKSALPNDLQTVLKTVTKYTNNTGGGSDIASYVTATIDTIFLLAEFEVFGIQSFANSAEQNYQAQYTYYSNGNSKIKYKHNAKTATAQWWLRSPTNAPISFCAVNLDGTIRGLHSYYSVGFVPAFCV